MASENIDYVDTVAVSVKTFLIKQNIAKVCFFVPTVSYIQDAQLHAQLREIVFFLPLI